MFYFYIVAALAVYFLAWFFFWKLALALTILFFIFLFFVVYNYKRAFTNQNQGGECDEDDDLEYGVRAEDAC